jgi:hypothetical protein
MGVMSRNVNRRGSLGKQRSEDTARPERVNTKKKPGWKKGDARNKGRPAGAVSKSYAEARRVAAATGTTPLEYMLQVMRDPGVPNARRDTMAIAAAPYMHARLAQLKHIPVDPNAPQREVHRIERVIYDSKDGALVAIPEEDQQVEEIKTIEGEAVEVPHIVREAAD